MSAGFPKRLVSARRTAGLSQRGLAFPGCTAAYISRLEAGLRVPSLQLVYELALRLSVDGDWLATGRRTDDLLAELSVARSKLLRIREIIDQ